MKALLVTGGANKGGSGPSGGPHTFLDSTEIYSFSDNSWTMAASLPSARFLHRAALLDNSIFIFGRNLTLQHFSKMPVSFQED